MTDPTHRTGRTGLTALLWVVTPQLIYVIQNTFTIPSMNTIIAEENYDMVRWLYQIKRVKPDRLGFIKNHFLHVFYFPLLRSSKLTRSNEDIKRAVNLWCDDATRAEAKATYGRISGWETSNVTNMAELFFGKSTFNDDISAWNVSNVTDMSSMFRNAHAFTGDLSAWVVTNVTVR